MLFRQTVCLLLTSCAPLWAGAERSSEGRSSDESSKIAQALQPFVDAHALAGAVTLIADKDKVLSLEAVGYADVAQKKPMRTDALFWIASQSKAMTAAAVMILVDEGKIKLDDPASKFLPELKNLWLIDEQSPQRMTLKRPSRPITIRDLLCHTSGMPFKSALEDPTLDQLTLKVGVGSYAMTPLLFSPGTKYQYSNAGINTAGRIVEVVSGMAYETFMDLRLFRPLGMNDKTFWPNEQQLARLAKSYTPNAAKTDLEETTVTQLHYPLNDRKRQPMPAGGLFSTAIDVAHFCQMLLNNGRFDGKTILSAEAVQQMTRKQTDEMVKESYGFGLTVGGSSRDSFGHGGAYATNMNVDVKRGMITVYMVQHAGFPKDGSKAAGVFRKAAEGRFASTAK